MTTQRVTSDRLAIEHLLPQQWETHWPVGTDPTAKAQRSQSVHLIGNLTLLTGRLNTKISHGPWAGEHGKWAALEKHDVLLLNRHVRQLGATGWDEQRIRHRTETLIDTILRIWPVPEGHASYNHRPGHQSASSTAGGSGGPTTTTAPHSATCEPTTPPNSTSTQPTTTTRTRPNHDLDDPPRSEPDRDDSGQVGQRKRSLRSTSTAVRQWRGTRRDYRAAAKTSDATARAR